MADHEADRPSILDNLSGAWLVMNGHAAGLARLDVSIAGFWRSFAAIFLLAPYLALGIMDQGLLRESTEPALAATASDNIPLQLFATGVDWLVFPLAFALLARPLGVADRYVPFIMARNWAAVIASGFFAVVTVAHLLGLASDAALPYLLIVTLGVTLRFSYLIVRTTLQVPVTVALPIVFLDILLSLVVQVGFARLM